MKQVEHTDPWDCDARSDNGDFQKPSKTMKNIISYSLYGNNPKYLKGAIANVYAAKQHYPDWTCRFYIDDNIDTSHLDTSNVEIIRMPKENGHLKMYWRFLPLTEPDIDYLMIRDTDSIITYREACAVKEWMDSRKSFHIMRDNPQHNVPICGGMWGCTGEFIKSYSSKHLPNVQEHLSKLLPKQIFHSRGMYFYTDQLYLWRYIWPLIRSNHLAHILNEDLRMSPTDRIFPEENPDGSYVGQIVF